MDEDTTTAFVCRNIGDNGVKCGAVITRTQKYCGECGCKVDPVWFISQSSDPLICQGLDEDGKVCGQRLAPAARFCSHCGTPNTNKLKTSQHSSLRLSPTTSLEEHSDGRECSREAVEVVHFTEMMSDKVSEKEAPTEANNTTDVSLLRNVELRPEDNTELTDPIVSCQITGYTDVAPQSSCSTIARDDVALVQSAKQQEKDSKAASLDTAVDEAPVIVKASVTTRTADQLTESSTGTSGSQAGENFTTIEASEFEQNAVDSRAVAAMHIASAATTANQPLEDYIARAVDETTESFTTTRVIDEQPIGDAMAVRGLDAASHDATNISCGSVRCASEVEPKKQVKRLRECKFTLRNPKSLVYCRSVENNCELDEVIVKCLNVVTYSKESYVVNTAAVNSHPVPKAALTIAADEQNIHKRETVEIQLVESQSSVALEVAATDLVEQLDKQTEVSVVKSTEEIGKSSEMQASGSSQHNKSHEQSGSGEPRKNEEIQTSDDCQKRQSQMQNDSRKPVEFEEMDASDGSQDSKCQQQNGSGEPGKGENVEESCGCHDNKSQKQTCSGNQTAVVANSNNADKLSTSRCQDLQTNVCQNQAANSGQKPVEVRDQPPVDSRKQEIVEHKSTETWSEVVKKDIKESENRNVAELNKSQYQQRGTQQPAHKSDKIDNLAAVDIRRPPSSAAATQKADGNSCLPHMTDNKESVQSTGDVNSASKLLPSDTRQSAQNQQTGMQVVTGYNKRDTKPPDYVPPTNKNNKTSSQSPLIIHVHFHVVLPKSEFHFKLSKDSVLMKFAPQKLGGWPDESHRMCVEKQIDENYILMKLTVSVDKTLLINTAFEYKYLVKRASDVLWEFIPKKVSHKEHVNRVLKVPKEHLERLSDWEQYDGVMAAKPDDSIWEAVKTGISKVFGQYHKKITDQTKLAAKAMLPSWSDIAVSQEKQLGVDCWLQKLDQVCLCVKSCFFNEDVQPDTGRIKEVLMEHIQSLILKFRSIPEKGFTESAEEAGVRLASACCVVYIVNKYELDFDGDDRKPLFKALLIRCDRAKQECHDYQQLVNIYFANDAWRKLIAESLQKFLEQMVTEPSSLLAIPLLHFLTNQSRPYVPGTPDRNHRYDPWWGITNISRYIEQFKSYYRPHMPIDFLVEQLSPLFEVDFLLPRTVLAVMNLEHILYLINKVSFPPEAILANLFYFINTGSCSESYTNFPGILDRIFTIMDSEVVSNGPILRRKDELCVKHWIACDLLDIICLHLHLQHHYGTVIAAIRVATATLSGLLKLKKLAVTETNLDFDVKNFENEVNDYIRGLLNYVGRWLNSVLSYRMVIMDFTAAVWSYMRTNMYEIKIYSDLMACSFSDPEVTALWKKEIDGYITSRLKALDPRATIFVFADPDVTNSAPEVEECFSRMAFEVLENSSRTTHGDFSSVFDANYTGEQAIKIRALLCKVFEKAWPQPVNDQPPADDVILGHVLNWSSFPHFLGQFYGRQSVEKILNPKTAECIGVAVSIFEKVVSDLMSGAITLQQLKLFLCENFKKSFLNVFKIIESSSKNRMRCVPDPVDLPGVDRSAVLLKVLTWRQREVQQFEVTRRLVHKFTDMCRDIHSDDLEHLKAQLQLNPDTLEIVRICVPLHYMPHLSVDNYEPVITFYNLGGYGELIFHHLEKYHGSIIFKEIWTRLLRPLKSKSVVGLDDIVKVVWQPSVRSYQQFCQKVTDEFVTFDEIDRYVSTFDKDCDAIEAELVLACDHNEEMAKQRRDKIEQYYKLNNYSQGAQLMLELRKMFGLTGNFTDVRVLSVLVTNKSQPLSCITPALVSSGKALEGLTNKEVECLKVLLGHQEQQLAEWLKTSLNDAKELKGFVDLAMISAQGSGDFELGKVLTLHAAATGYAPLIYDLKPSMGFSEFLPLCKAVWRTLKVDAKLPDKFSDIARHIEWLDRIKESHGSVEVSALALAAEVNEHGIYIVGNLSDEQKKGLADVLELHLPNERIKDETEVERGWRVLSLQQLTDLQSTLMLIAGKAKEGKEQVERFVEMLDSVTRLGSLYLSICNAGCTLFQNWKSVFYCDPKRTGYNTHVRFGENESHVMTGSKSTLGGEVLNHIHDLCTFLEDCLNEWLCHVDTMRTESFYLNYFTTQQLVILQNELAKINTTDWKNLNKLVFPMLSVFKKNCTVADIRTAMRKAFEDLKEADAESELKNVVAVVAASTVAEANIEADSSDDKLENVSDKELCARFMSVMDDSGFSVSLAQRALKEVGAENVDEGLMWCMEHQNDFESPAEAAADAATVTDQRAHQSTDGDSDDDDDEFPADKWMTRGLKLSSNKEKLTYSVFDRAVIASRGVLLNRLRVLWTTFQKEMNTSVADCLSLLHLGNLLENLAQSDIVQLNRTIPKYLKHGQPNLIVCSQNEVLNVVVSLYLYEGGANIALPGSDEVLVCNALTTAEDVELLWRRAEGDARGDRHGKIYALVHAELLDYEVSRRVEESLEKYSHAVDALQLVVVCCRELEDRCHMINALDRYRVKMLSVDTVDVQNYLKSHFTVGNIAGSALKPAAAVDPERCCVRVIKSHRAGVGKTLKVKRLHERLQEMVKKPKYYRGPLLITIPLHCRTVDQSAVLKTLLEHTLEPQQFIPRIFHIDIAHEVQEGVDYLLFNLLILGSITDREGFVWTRSPADLYVIETMPLMQRDNTRSVERHQHQQQLHHVHHIFHLIPSLTCWSPVDSLRISCNNIPEVERRYVDAKVNRKLDQLMDEMEFHSEMFQRPLLYLQRELQYTTPAGNVDDCITLLLQHCGVVDPSWSEIAHFANFLNIQLEACEQSIFCSPVMAPDLPGFLEFVVQFMIHMSKDFATRSLQISEETPHLAVDIFNHPDVGDGQNDENILAHYGLKRRWETSPHPYLFFNADRGSFTFMGFVIHPQSGDVLDPRTHEILSPAVLDRRLQFVLRRNGVNLSEDFDELPRIGKITKMCHVMGIEDIFDPDETYELTADNVKKMLAIYMRFRCNIPVIVMGETGCGKTRLIKFMCDLWKPPGAPVTNMILMKVHGGTTAEDIVRKVDEAVQHAEQNLAEFPNMQTVLFFDEANTTEDIGLIKEIMCDRTIRGKQLMETHGLKLIAACNPYRKHSDEMIERLEHAGLGYHIEANQTTDKLGRIPMRQLVYRVQALPQSMLPLVWDFGQLDRDVEELYIRQMVHRYLGAFVDLVGFEQPVSSVLAACQQFMRRQQDECSFVSLRDVDRTLQVMLWFYQQDALFELIDLKALKEIREQTVSDDGEQPDNNDDGDDDEDIETAEHSLAYTPPHNLTRSLILAVGVCYHACLQNRQEFREDIAQYFTGPIELDNGPDTIEQNISWCQDAFLHNLELGPNIARNQALKENVFMMVVCIELRIPLFLVGKPGSSKSLAKTIVADAMQGETARTELFRTLKSVHMVSYQCSPLSTPDGIVGIFHQCAKLQQNQDLNKFVSVVVLDEVGLAEDSPRMPLKTLHPLLEYGCEGDEEPAAYKKVGFIGISNWALDPAKMNRGILVQRGVPDVAELEESARGICSSSRLVLKRIEDLLRPLAAAYLELYNSALERQEFFGLRDFYSLIKMVYSFVNQSNKPPTWYELQHAILRNFGGLDNVKPIAVFEKHLTNIDKNALRLPTDPYCDATSLILSSLHSSLKLEPAAEAEKNNPESRSSDKSTDLESETRYLLILTENYAALNLHQQDLLNIQDAIIIFGSSFPKDQEYTQVCRNINRIKVCMETGQTVVLLNQENLYESLYDALNQYYTKFGDQRFVDLGLGTQRVKCRVHLNFRLIVVAEKKVVYEKFPIPLINRLEKHFLAMDTMLTEEQRELAERLERWANDFADTGAIQSHNQRGVSRPQVGDVFIGYHADTAASVVLQVSPAAGAIQQHLDIDQVFTHAQEVFLRCATPESIVRLSSSRLAQTQRQIEQMFANLHQDNIDDFMKQNFVENKPTGNMCLQVTTHSRLLLTSDAARNAALIKSNIDLRSLQEFDTEQQFCKMLKEVFGAKSTGSRLLILQCDSGHVYTDLIACARYNITNEYNQSSLVDSNTAAPLVHVLFIIQLPRIAGGCFIGFQGGRWKCYHIDDLHATQERLPPLSVLREHSVSSLFTTALHSSAENHPPRSDDGSGDWVHDRRERSMVTKLDFDDIVRNCLHQAAAMLKDSEEQRQRKMNRLQLLVDLLSTRRQDVGDLLNILKQRICRLLDDKEKMAMTPNIANNWLSNEAASFQAINKAGTFRRSLTQYLESCVTPLLARIIAFADTNGNFDILCNVESNVDLWLREMWFDMLRNDDVTVLKYRDLQSTSQQSVLKQFDVKLYSSRSFSPRLPFSWVVMEQVDRIVYSCKQTSMHYSHNDIERMLQEGALGTVLQKAYSAGGFDNVVDRYLSDYICMVYKPSSGHLEQEYQLVIADLKFETEQRFGGEADQTDQELTDPETGNGASLTLNSVLSIPAVHLMFDAIHRRVQIFSQLAQGWPQCVPTLAQATRVQPMPLDLKSLLSLMESLEPQKETLNNQKTRAEWSERVRSVTPLVLRLQESVNSAILQKYMALVDNCRFKWNRVCALQLFIQNVCPPGAKDDLTVKNCMPLWNMLGESADFKTDKSLQTVEGFLKICNKNASEHYFGKTVCPSCSGNVESPVQLPCNDTLCLKCVNEILRLKVLVCPQCQKSIPATFKPEILRSKQSNAEEHNRYKQRCNAFLMELVSRLCFTDSIPPEPKAVQRLMGYITCQSKVAETTQTKKMAVYDDVIDPTPVVRSFLLQLLLRSDVVQVREYLQNFFNQAAETLCQADKQHIFQLCLLCVQCLEDHYHTTCSQIEDTSKQLKYTKDLLKEARQTLMNIEDSTVPRIETLESVAKARHGLQLCALWLHRLYVQQDVDQHLKTDARRLCDMAAYLCEAKLTWPRLFLMKQIVRQFGMDALKQISNVREVKWLVPLDAQDNQNEVSADRFVVCGNNYKQLRELLAEIVLGRDVNSLTESLQATIDNETVCECNLLLAIYREITVNTGNTTRQAPDTVLQTLDELLQNSQFVKNKTLAAQLLHNTLPADMLQVAGQSPANCSIMETLVHFDIVINSLQNNRLLRPLIALATCDGTMANAFLPTMPQDDLDDIKEALLQARPRTGQENPVFYQCPNGHPYVIGNCGRPNEQNVCRACGAAIGGLHHTLVAGNAQIHNFRDNTRRGHILGAAPQRRDPVPERQMTAASTAILRLLTHMAMYLGATHNVQVVYGLINPAVTNVTEFLWRHMTSDVSCIQKAVGHSLDDVILLIHILVNRVLLGANIGYDGDVLLNTKQTRQQWENSFVQQYITPVLQDVNRQLQRANADIVNDERLGNNPLMRMLYEVDVDVKPTDDLVETPSLWRYRARVSLEHVKRELEEQRSTGTGKNKNKNKKQSPFPVLELFLKEEPYLQALRWLPSVTRLHRQLVSRLNRSIENSWAADITIEDYLLRIEEDNIHKDFELLINDFLAAWESIRPHLVNYSFDNGRTLPTEFIDEPVDKTKTCLAMLLPSLRGYGLCSIALTYFLFQKQNNFLEAYSQITKCSLEGNTVDLCDAGNAHLVSFHPERDLLPIILSNCNYSLELGKGTKIEYDFMSMEKQVEERFIRGRPRLQYQTDFIVYQEEFTDAAVFTKLRDRIPQEPLVNTSLIEKELLQKLPEVNDLLASLDITVGFLVSVAGDPNASLVKFMTETLQMKHRQQLINVIESCQLKHVESLWILLSYMRACMQANYGQNPFDNIDEKYQEEITDDLLSQLRLGLQHINLETFLPALHQCILFRIAVKQDVNDEDYVNNVDQPLGAVLQEYINEQSDQQQQPTVMPATVMPALSDGRFPADIKLRHCVTTWRTALDISHRQQQQQQQQRFHTSR